VLRLCPAILLNSDLLPKGNCGSGPAQPQEDQDRESRESTQTNFTVGASGSDMVTRDGNCLGLPYAPVYVPDPDDEPPRAARTTNTAHSIQVSVAAEGSGASAAGQR